MLVGIVFWVLAVVAVTAGAAVFVVDSMARATYALALSFIAVGVQILLLGQSYLGIITILMMVMEMAVEIDGYCSGGTSPSRQGAGTETFYPPNLPFGGGGTAELFLEKRQTPRSF